MIHILEKYTVDKPNSRFRSVWHQCVIRPMDISYERFLDLISGKWLERGKPTKDVTVWKEMPCCLQNEDESDSEFLMRASIEGFGPEFEDHLELDDDWKIKILETVDLTTGKIWPNPPRKYKQEV